MNSAFTRLQAEVGARLTAARTIKARSDARATRAPSAAQPNAVDGLLTIDEACRYLGLSRSALYRRLADPSPGSLRTIARPLPGSGHLRFNRAELDAWSARDKKRS
ncbi:MAG: helix-turn-helix domain-containing protein [Planctomycetes bacterium]|nr:helix-turn-helix domain-containing protein [Planctomycetota bacterium]